MFGGVVEDRRAAPRPGRAKTPAVPAGPARRPPPKDVELPADVRAELTAAVGRKQAEKLAERMAAAARAYERDRYPEAMRITKSLVQDVPESSSARELHGLVCYRLGRWREAVRNLEAARDLSADDPSQLPVLMDCHRAQGHHRRVAELWEELREASPDADVLAEGRVVYASDLADQGDLERAVSVLTAAGAGRTLRHPADRHIRQWYVLADLLERAGDLPGARRLFAQVAEADPELADARLRLAALGSAGRGGPARRR